MWSLRILLGNGCGHTHTQTPSGVLSDLNDIGGTYVAGATGVSGYGEFHVMTADPQPIIYNFEVDVVINNSEALSPKVDAKS